MKKSLLVMMVGTGLFALVACSDEMEEAGQEVQEATEEVNDAVQEASAELKELMLTALNDYRGDYVPTTKLALVIFTAISGDEFYIQD